MLCSKSDMFVTYMTLKGKHQATEMCIKGEDNKLKRLREEEAHASTSVFQAYSIPMLTVTAFKYLGWVLTTYDDESPEVDANIRKDLSRWASLFRIFGQDRS